MILCMSDRADILQHRDLARCQSGEGGEKGRRGGRVYTFSM